MRTASTSAVPAGGRRTGPRSTASTARTGRTTRSPTGRARRQGPRRQGPRRQGPEEGKGHEEPDWKGPDGKGHEEGKGPEEGKGHEEAPKPEPKGGAGGGAAADGEHDWKGEEHGQDAEGPKYDERTGPEGDERGEYSREGEKPGEHGREGAKPGEGPGHEGEWWADRGWEREAEHAEGDRWEKGKDFVYYGEARVAEDAKPGTYKLEGSCGEGELVVLPHGGVKAGDGGAAGGADRGLATAGAGLVGAAALGGLVLLRRRRADEFAA
ncbi:hypothetical protein [Micromonospora endophytica]|uniref:hypothetical protein n=1 Tax=Micromonospora endophytica TaxID=515350 RepID=UPI002017C92F|nr:hypothetical protein [Micromonospora endophytica]